LGLDAVASLEQNNPISFTDVYPARIGAASDRISTAWIGFIDEVRIYAGVLTKEENAAFSAEVIGHRCSLYSVGDLLAADAIHPSQMGGRCGKA